MNIGCFRGPGKIREAVWQDRAGIVVRYNLALIHHVLCQKDNGRVLGYDSAHGRHYRHFMGKLEDFEFVSYEALTGKFFNGEAELCKKSRKED